MRFLLFGLLIITSLQVAGQSLMPGWPQTSRQAKPWTRWWWHGSAVTKEGLTAELESLKNAGIGGVEITPIFGVNRYESQFVNFLSPQWMELLVHVLKEAERLDLGVDMATGTGWPFGGPWVTEADACKNFQYKVFALKGGSTLAEKIEFTSTPYVRAIGSYLYDIDGDGNRKLKDGFSQYEGRKIDINNLKQPIDKNPDLQALAIDQFQFAKKLPLQTVMAYSATGKTIDVTRFVTSEGTLQWTAPSGDWKLYAVFQGWHGKMVERAAPGGEGNVIDHFSPAAMDNYFNYFDKAFASNNISSLRAFFNDSYEVDDARGAADWTPAMFDEFKNRRGYDLRQHLPALFGKDTKEKNERILLDYRQTISDMLKDHFTRKWKAWAAKHGAIIRNQAHGSPANILDLYAIVDIPEIEGTEPLRIKMASSAGNVTGKALVSSESATWLDDHFESNLHETKEALDRFMLNGVNHMFYHGTAYSPANDPWPGWLFYAAVHFNNRNPFWDHFSTLNKYVERCQSFLQNSKADNDVLLYFPVYDGFAHKGSKTIEHFDAIDKKFEGSSFAKTAEMLYDNKIAFDYISDAQIENISLANGVMVSEGKSQYKTLIIPGCRYMPVETLEKIAALVKSGANVIFVNGLPASFPGVANFNKLQKRFNTAGQIISNAGAKHQTTKVFASTDPNLISKEMNLPSENLPEGLSYIRKKQHDGVVMYFVNNRNGESFEGWVPLNQNSMSVIIYDPMTGEFGKAKSRRTEKGKVEVYVQLDVQQSLILQCHSAEVQAVEFFYGDAGISLALTGKWQLDFLKGGPKIPTAVAMTDLSTWTTLPSSDYADFSGTASYKITFSKPVENAEAYILDLGIVQESAMVIMNGEQIGTLIGPSYKIRIAAHLLKDTNTLEVQVANSMANRIIYLERNNVYWKKFYNVNFPALKAENRANGIFDASQWKPRESGLLGPVTITPLKVKTVF